MTLHRIRQRSRGATGRRTRVVPLMAVSMLIVGSAVGCSDDATPRDASSVTLVTYEGYALPEAPAEQFRSETGQRIEVLASGDGGAALTRVLAASGAPEGDVFFGVDTTFLSRAQESDAFVEYRPEGLQGVDPSVLDPGGALTPIDEATVCVDYDQTWFAQRQIPPPTSFEDLIDPRLADLTVVIDPAVSTPGLAFVAATAATFGGDVTDYWQALSDNGVAIAGGWSDAWFTRYTVSGGDRPIVVSYASSPPAEVVGSDDPTAVPATAVVTSTCIRQVEYAGVLRGAANPSGARALIDEMLSDRWQAALPLSNFVLPIRSEIELPDVFERFAVRPERPIVVDPATIGRQRDAWISAWRSVME